MRIVADVGSAIMAMATVIGLLLRYYRRKHGFTLGLPRKPNLEHMRELEEENQEMDKILERMGANDVSSVTKRDERQERDGPERRGVRRPERNQ